MKTVLAYELWRTDNAVLLAPKESQRKGEWVGLDKALIVPAGLENRNAVNVTASEDVLRRAGLICSTL